MKKRKEEPPHPQYDLMCKLNDCRTIISDQRAMLKKLDDEIVECLRFARKESRP
jgi:hypothetical protein